MKIKYINDAGRSIEFKYSRPFFLNSIEGLGFKNEINTMEITGWDGEKVINDSLNSRDITITATLITTDKIQVNKKKKELLKVFNPKLKGYLIISKKGVEERKIKCTVQSITWARETTSAQEFVIRLYCMNPYLTNIQHKSKDIALWINDFAFPLEIVESGIEIGHRAKSLIVNAQNDGDVETGMIIKFRAQGHVKNPSLFNVNTRKFIKLNTDMKQGDVITITTEQGNKKVKLKSSVDNEKDIFNKMDLSSTFLQLNTGDNLFRYNADENINNLEVSISYMQKYLGV